MRAYICIQLVTLFIFSHFFVSSAHAQNNVKFSNPEISVNGLFLGRVGSDGSSRSQESANGFHIQEIETRLTANVDPYFRADFTLAFEKEPGQDFVFTPEEAFIESLSLPSVTLRLGKFRAFLGKHNQYHTHSFPFIDLPLIYEQLVGEEGLNEIGASAAVLLPVPWFSEFVAQGFSATNENLFTVDRANAIAGLFHSKNLWDLNKTTTFELTGSYGIGQNDFGSNSQIYSASSTLKWRPLEKSIYRRVAWTTEFLQTFRDGAPDNELVGGVSSWLQWQFARRWWIQGRYDYLGLPDPDDGTGYKASALLAFVPSEFSALRLQYDALSEPGPGDMQHIVTLQLNFTIGAHPAHDY